VALHPEVEVSITINVARSADEAERIARGEDVIAPREERLVMATGEAAAAEDLFEHPENVRDEGERSGDGEEKPKTKDDK
jgi:large subunit ribosomal protein L9